VPIVPKFVLVRHKFSMYAPAWVWQFDSDVQTDTHTDTHTYTLWLHIPC